MSTTYPDLSYTVFPESIQTFVTMLNMVVADGPAVLGYQQAMQNGDLETAQQYYQQITNADQKFINAEKMNTLMDTCVALQRFYQTDIFPYISDKQTEWASKIDEFEYKGRYSNSTNYYKNNFVVENVNGVDNVFICINDAPVGTYPTNTEYWRQLTVRGAQGVSGDTSLTFRYEWDSSQIYRVQDVVTYDESVWGCIADNTNSPPSISSSYWKLIYSPVQTIYPFSNVQPSSYLEEGNLWFEILPY